MRTLLQRLEEDLKGKKDSLVKFFTFALFFTLLITVVFYFPYFHVIGSLDVSMPQRFYLWIKPSSDPKEKDKQIRKYRYVEVFVGDLTRYDPVRRKGVLYLIKKVVCFPGDYLLAESGKFYCNGRFIGKAHPKAPADPFSYRGKIPEGKYFILGTSSLSFDSRYMGLMDGRRITGVLIPLF